MRADITRAPRIQGWFAAATAVLLTVVGVIRAGATQILSSDGSFGLLVMVSKRGFSLSPNRQWVDILCQFPTVIGLRVFNVHSYHTLALLLGLGYFVIPAAICALAVYTARNDRTLLLYAAVSSCLLLSLADGMATESAVATAIFICCSTVLLLPERLSMVKVECLAIAALLTWNTYESFAVLAPVLVIFLIVRQRRADRRLPTWQAMLVGSILAVTSIFNWLWLLTPNPNPDRYWLIQQGTGTSWYSEAARMAILWTFVIIAMLLVLGIVVDRLTSGVTRPVLAGLVAVGVVLILEYHAHAVQEIPEYTYFFRGDMAALAVMLSLVACGIGILTAHRLPGRGTMWVVIAFGALALISSVGEAQGWTRYQTAFAHGVATHHGSVPVTGLGIPAQLELAYYWGWTESDLGIVLSCKQGVVGVRNLPGNSPSTFGDFENEVFYYAAHPSLKNLPRDLRGYRW
jgi:hypothetical protein